jgi:hypothetical protein
MLGMEPTAKRRGLDNHRTTVEHNLRAGEGTVQIHPRWFTLRSASAVPALGCLAAYYPDRARIAR